MANYQTDIFRFRHFQLEQASSGQRINTDSCAFGALVNPATNPRRILDIGAGTGLLCLMMAQRFGNSEIIGIEPEPIAAQLAEKNLRTSPWGRRCGIYPWKAEDLKPLVIGRFDLVIANPPFFRCGLPSPDPLRTQARHAAALTARVLFKATAAVLTAPGSLWILCPTQDEGAWCQEGVEFGFHLKSRHWLVDHPKALPHRCILAWTRYPEAAPATSTTTYRQSQAGPQSAWMQAFRAAWFPDEFNDSQCSGADPSWSPQ